MLTAFLSAAFYFVVLGNYKKNTTEISGAAFVALATLAALSFAFADTTDAAREEGRTKAGLRYAGEKLLGSLLGTDKIVR